MTRAARRANVMLRPAQPPVTRLDVGRGVIPAAVVADDVEAGDGVAAVIQGVHVPVDADAVQRTQQKTRRARTP